MQSAVSQPAQEAGPLLHKVARYALYVDGLFKQACDTGTESDQLAELQRLRNTALSLLDEQLQTAPPWLQLRAKPPHRKVLLGQQLNTPLTLTKPVALEVRLAVFEREASKLLRSLELGHNQPRATATTAPEPAENPTDPADTEAKDAAVPPAPLAAEQCDSDQPSGTERRLSPFQLLRLGITSTRNRDSTVPTPTSAPSIRDDPLYLVNLFKSQSASTPTAHTGSGATVSRLPSYRERLAAAENTQLESEINAIPEETLAEEQALWASLERATEENLLEECDPCLSLAQSEECDPCLSLAQSEECDPCLSLAQSEECDPCLSLAQSLTDQQEQLDMEALTDCTAALTSEGSMLSQGSSRLADHRPPPIACPRVTNSTPSEGTPADELLPEARAMRPSVAESDCSDQIRTKPPFHPMAKAGEGGMLPNDQVLGPLQRAMARNRGTGDSGVAHGMPQRGSGGGGMPAGASGMHGGPAGYGRDSDGYWASSSDTQSGSGGVSRRPSEDARGGSNPGMAPVQQPRLYQASANLMQDLPDNQGPLAKALARMRSTQSAGGTQLAAPVALQGPRPTSLPASLGGQNPAAVPPGAPGAAVPRAGGGSSAGGSSGARVGQTTAVAGLPQSAASSFTSCSSVGALPADVPRPQRAKKKPVMASWLKDAVRDTRLKSVASSLAGSEAGSEEGVTAADGGGGGATDAGVPVRRGPLSCIEEESVRAANLSGPVSQLGTDAGSTTSHQVAAYSGSSVCSNPSPGQAGSATQTGDGRQGAQRTDGRDVQEGCPSPNSSQYTCQSTAAAQQSAQSFATAQQQSQAASNSAPAQEVTSAVVQQGAEGDPQAAPRTRVIRTWGPPPQPDTSPLMADGQVGERVIGESFDFNPPGSNRGAGAGADAAQVVEQPPGMSVAERARQFAMQQQALGGSHGSAPGPHQLHAPGQFMGTAAPGVVQSTYHTASSGGGSVPGAPGGYMQGSLQPQASVASCSPGGSMSGHPAQTPPHDAPHTAARPTGEGGQLHQVGVAQQAVGAEQELQERVSRPSREDSAFNEEPPVRPLEYPVPPQQLQPYPYVPQQRPAPQAYAQLQYTQAAVQYSGRGPSPLSGYRTISPSTGRVVSIPGVRAATLEDTFGPASGGQRALGRNQTMPVPQARHTSPPAGWVAAAPGVAAPTAAGYSIHHVTATHGPPQPTAGRPATVGGGGTPAVAAASAWDQQPVQGAMYAQQPGGMTVVQHTQPQMTQHVQQVPPYMRDPSPSQHWAPPGVNMNSIRRRSASPHGLAEAPAPAAAPVRAVSPGSAPGYVAAGMPTHPMTSTSATMVTAQGAMPAGSTQSYMGLPDPDEVTGPFTAPANQRVAQQGMHAHPDAGRMRPSEAAAVNAEMEASLNGMLLQRQVSSARGPVQQQQLSQGVQAFSGPVPVPANIPGLSGARARQISPGPGQQAPTPASVGGPPVHMGLGRREQGPVIMQPAGHAHGESQAYGVSVVHAELQGQQVGAGGKRLGGALPSPKVPGLAPPPPPNAGSARPGGAARGPPGTPPPPGPPPPPPALGGSKLVVKKGADSGSTGKRPGTADGSVSAGSVTSSTASVGAYGNLVDTIKAMGASGAHRGHLRSLSKSKAKRGAKGEALQMTTGRGSPMPSAAGSAVKHTPAPAGMGGHTAVLHPSPGTAAGAYGMLSGRQVHAAQVRGSHQAVEFMQRLREGMRPSQVNDSEEDEEDGVDSDDGWGDERT